MLPSCCLGIVRTAWVLLFSWGLRHTRRSSPTLGDVAWSHSPAQLQPQVNRTALPKHCYAIRSLKIFRSVKATTLLKPQNKSYCGRKHTYSAERQMILSGFRWFKDVFSKRKKWDEMFSSTFVELKRKAADMLFACGSYCVIWSHSTAVYTDVSSR